MEAPDPHQPVLLREVVELLAVAPAGVYVDATYGRGGHSRAIAERLGRQGKLLVIDKDPEAVAAAHAQFGADERVAVEQGSFAALSRVVERRGLMGQVNGVLLDLGVSSVQLDDARRGFSFRRAGPLDMRMDPGAGMTAADWLATAAERDIADVLFQLGEERYARRIARALVAARQEAPIDTTRRLAEIITAAVPTRERHKDPATRSFQAIRIFINRELDDLRDCLSRVAPVLAPHGRLAVISFHSLEDRIVKRFIRDQSRGETLPLDLPVRDAQRHAVFRPVGKAVRPGAEEVARNPRSRSAVLRVAERLP